MTTHAMYKTREYRAWARMKEVCFNPNCPRYPNFGGKGVAVCSEWLMSFAKFLEDMGPIPADCNAILQIDESLDFCKINCKWGIRKQGRPPNPRKHQPSKKRNSFKNGISLCITIEKDLLDYIRTQSLHASVQQGSIVEANDLIRDALSKSFPLPKQMDMFGGKK